MKIVYVVAVRRLRRLKASVAERPSGTIHVTSVLTLHSPLMEPPHTFGTSELCTEYSI